MKRLLYLGLCLLLVAGMLTGCLSTPNDGNGTTVGTEDGTNPPNGNTDATGTGDGNTTTGDNKNPVTDDSSGTTADNTNPPEPPHTHVDADGNGVCDDETCGEILFYTVTIEAPENVTVSANKLTADPGKDVTFTVTADTAYRIKASNATFEGKVKSEDGNAYVWTYSVKSLSANVAVNVTAERTVYGAAVDSGYGSIALEEGKMVYYTPMTVTVPAAGDYIIYAVDVTNGEPIKFTFEEGGDREAQLEFTAEAAGHIELLSYFFAWSDPVDEFGDPLTAIEFEYYVVSKADLNVTLNGLSGEGYTLPTNVVMNVSVTLPTTGMYQLVSDVANLSCNYSQEILILNATEDGQTITFTMILYDDVFGTFDFDWEIENLSATQLQLGNNTVTTSYGKYVTLSYTVEAIGSYRIAVAHEDADLFYWSVDYGTMSGYYSNAHVFDETLSVGDVITVYLELSVEDEYEDIDTVVTVEYLGKILGSDHVAAAGSGENGAKNAFDPGYNSGWYLFQAPDGAQIGVMQEDGTIAWESSIEVYLNEEVFAFYVKAAEGIDEVILDINKQNYSQTLSVGENTVTLKPNRDYTITLSGLTETSSSTPYKKYYDFILSWTADENLQVTYQGNPYESGTTITGYRTSSSSYKLVVTNTSDEEMTLTLTLQDPNAQQQGGDSGDETNRGEAYTLSGKYNVNFRNNLAYVLSFSDGTLVIVDEMSGDYSGTYAYTVDDAYTVTLTQNGEVVSALMIAFDTDGYPTFAAPMMVAQPMVWVGEASGDGGDDSGDDSGNTSSLILGTNAFDVPKNGELELTFTATVTGTYTFTMTDANGYLSYIDDAGDSNGFEYGNSFSIELNAGDAFTVYLSTWDYEADNIEFTIALEGDSGTGDGDDTPAQKTIANGTYQVNFVMDGMYVLVFNNGSLHITDNNSTLYSGNYLYSIREDGTISIYDLSMESVEALTLAFDENGGLTFSTPNMGAQPLVYVSTSTEIETGDDGDEGGESGDSLVLGTNSIDVEDGYNGVEVTFTATESGTYVFTVADANGYVSFEMDSWVGNGATYTVDLATGESFVFVVGTDDMQPDIIDIEIAIS